METLRKFIFMAVRFILASGSPRRKELLSGLLSEFEVIVPQTKELTEHHHGPSQLSLSNAWLKAKAVAENYCSDWVLGSDTVVAIGNKVLETCGYRCCPQNALGVFG